MCKLGCDDLFERGYVTAAAGEWVAHREKLRLATEAVRGYLEKIAGKPCLEWAKASRYFNWHARRHAFELG